MSFLDNVPAYIKQLQDDIALAGGQRYEINWGHDCDCEYCHRRGDDADPDAEAKAAAIDRRIKECQQMIRKLERYAGIV